MGLLCAPAGQCGSLPELPRPADATAVVIRPCGPRLQSKVLANHAKARSAYERCGFTPQEVMYEKRIAPKASEPVKSER